MAFKNMFKTLMTNMLASTPALSGLLEKGRLPSASDLQELAILLSDQAQAEQFLLKAPALNSTPTPFACGIINAKSGRCSENCAFCAQSQHHITNAPVHPLVSQKALLERAYFLAENGVDRMGIVTSGAGPTAADLDSLCEAARAIGEQVGIKLCASLGVLTADRALRLKQAGFESYHHNLETSHSFYPTICSTHSYDIRRETVLRAKEAGLRVCSGGLFGLGESWEQRIELSGTLQDLDVDSIPVNFLMPITGTPLEDSTLLSAAEGLTIIFLLRAMHPARDIVLCGGRTSTLGENDQLAFPSFANGLMVGDYLTEKGGVFTRDLNLIKARRRI